MATITESGADPWDPRQDRKIYLVWIGLNWIGMIAGFGYDFSRYLAQLPPPPLLIHVHAVVFGLWLFVQTAQIVLITRGDFRMHRQLAVYALGLAAVMIPLGLAAALTAKFRHLGMAGTEPQFLAVNLLDIISFGLFILAGYLLRRDPASHKRMMMLAMVAITDPGFSRFSDAFMHDPGPGHFWIQFLYNFWGNALLIGLMTGWDLWRRRTLNPAFAIGATLLLGSELFAMAIYYDATWKQIAISIIKAWGYGG
jgi:hypothetical protein